MGHPIRLTLGEDLRRSRLMVFFRLPLVLVHVMWLAAWSAIVIVAVILGWFAALLTGRLPDAVHRFLAAYLRYATHVSAFLFLAANPFPGFTGAAGSYPVDVQVPAPQRQNRWKTGFRVILALPALMLASALAGGGLTVGGGYFSLNLSLLAICALLGWFVALIRARIPAGFRDAMALGLAYSAQQLGYLLLLTDRYPNSNPETLISAVRPPARWAEVVCREDTGRRNRLAVFFRLLLVLPHLLWLALWGSFTLLVVFVDWFALLIAGRAPELLHRLIGAYLRYQLRVTAYAYLLADRYPSFLPRAGRDYAVGARFGEREPQNRWKTLFRFVLAWPAALLAAGYGGVLATAALLGWFAALFTGRMPLGLRNLGLACVSYGTQASAYWMLLTDRYPYTGPCVPGAEAHQPLPEAAGHTNE